MAVNLSPVGGVAAQFFDNNGVILSGGKIYTYASGTTTNQATYTSAAGTTAHSNPIILDSAGRVPSGEIWLTDGLQYKFVVKNSNDVLIGTYDNIIGINSNFVNFLTETEIQTATAGQTVFTLTTMQYQPGTNNLSVFVDGVNQYDGSSYSYVETNSTTVTFTAGLHVGALVKFTTSTTLSTGVTDASLVTYQPPFTAGVGTNVEVKLSEYVSVIDFGASGDGVTDDTLAVQNAISASYGKTLFFPTGTYLCSDLSVTGNITFKGEIGSTIKYGANGTSSLINVTGTSTKFSTFGLTYNGNYSNQTADTYSISFAAVGTSTDPSIFNAQENTFLNGNYADIYVGTDSSYSTIDVVDILNNTFLGGKEGTATKDTRYVSITSPCNLDFSGNFVDFAATPTTYGRAGIVSWISGYVGYASRGSICNNIMHNVGRSSNASNGTLGAIDGYAGAVDLVIDGNTIVNPYGRGIQVKSNANNVVISNNTVDGLLDLTSGAAVDAQITVNRSTTTEARGSISIIGNVCKSSGWDGISVSCANTDFSNSATPILISGNTVANANRRGIGLLQSVFATVTGNIVSNTTTAEGIYVANNGGTGNVLITDNNVSYAATSGIYVATIGSLSCSNNILSNNTGYDISIGAVTNGLVSNNQMLSTTPFEFRGALTSYSGVVFENNKAETSISMMNASISASTIPAISNFIRVYTASPADLTTISNGYNGMTVVLVRANSTVTVKNGTGNLKLASDFALDNNTKTITLIRIGSYWYETCRSSNT